MGQETAAVTLRGKKGTVGRSLLPIIIPSNRISAAGEPSSRTGPLLKTMGKLMRPMGEFMTERIGVAILVLLAGAFPSFGQTPNRIWDKAPALDRVIEKSAAEDGAPSASCPVIEDHEVVGSSGGRFWAADEFLLWWVK